MKLVNDTIVWEVGVEMGWEQRVYLGGGMGGEENAP